MELVVARVGRAHGVRGELTVEVRTDDPGTRLTAGSVLRTDPGAAGPLTVRTARDHNGTLLLTFEQVRDRGAADALRGTLLLVEVDDTDADDDDDAWYPSQLVGLRAVTVDGVDVGEVVRVEHLPAQDLLVVRRAGGGEALVPFVTAIVPEVDVAGGRVVLDPPAGLLELADPVSGENDG